MGRLLGNRPPQPNLPKKVIRRREVAQQTSHWDTWRSYPISGHTNSFARKNSIRPPSVITSTACTYRNTSYRHLPTTGPVCAVHFAKKHFMKVAKAVCRVNKIEAKKRDKDCEFTVSFPSSSSASTHAKRRTPEVCTPLALRYPLLQNMSLPAPFSLSNLLKILSICNVHPQDANPPYPSFSTLQSRIQRAFHSAEADTLLSYLSTFEQDEASFWKLASSHMSMREKPPSNQGYESHLSLLAKAEVEQLCAVRMRFREKKRKQGAGNGRTQPFDCNGSAESALEMIEALPQGKFCS